MFVASRPFAAATLADPSLAPDRVPVPLPVIGVIVAEPVASLASEPVALEVTVGVLIAPVPTFTI